MYKHILIATDGSEVAGRGVDHGLELAGRLGAEVTMVTVTEPLRPSAIMAARQGGVADPFGMYERQMDEAVGALDKLARERSATLGIKIEVVRDTDDSPAQAIVRTAKLRGCDLIVMASHGRRGLQRVLLGSQTSEVLVHTTVPVLVVR